MVFLRPSSPGMECVSWCWMLTPVAVRPGSVARQVMWAWDALAASRSFSACAAEQGNER